MSANIPAADKSSMASLADEMKAFNLEMKKQTLELKKATEPSKIARQLAQQA